MARRGGEKAEEAGGDRVEQIVRRDGRIYYGERPCRDAEEAYELFRNEYHASIGRQAFLRLNRLGQRKERIHGFGFDFAKRIDGSDFCGGGTVFYRLAGKVGISYLRVFGLNDYGSVPDEEFEQWFDWALSRGSGALKLKRRLKRK